MLLVNPILGDITTSEILEAIDRSVGDPRFRKGYGVLSDHTGIGEPLTPPQAKEMVAHLASLAGSMAGARWAMISTKEASYGMRRMVSILAESVPMQVEVFRTAGEAEARLFSASPGRS